TFPAVAGVYGTAAWNAGCGTPSVGDVCGTASDNASGVQKVEVSIKRGSDGLYWNGAAFVSGETWLPASGTSNWNYAFSIPADGAYTVKSRATDNSGNVESTFIAGFTVDVTAPVVTNVGSMLVAKGVPVPITANVTDATAGVSSVKYALDDNLDLDGNIGMT